MFWAQSTRPPLALPASRFLLSAVLALSLFFVSLLAASPSPQLTGSYKVIASTDLGTEMRFTAELNFFNPADSAVTVTGISLRSALSPGHMVSTATNLTVQSHSKAQATVQFVVPKKDFNAWSAGPHQLFLIKIQAGEAKPVMANVVLLRTK